MFEKYSEYKGSEIEWLDDIPQHWEVRPLKLLANVVLGKMLCNEDKGNYKLKPYLKSKNIQWLNVNVSSVDEMWFSQNELKEYRLRQGDLILSEGGEVGKTCIWDNELSECYIQNSAHKVTFNSNCLSKYFLYVLFIQGKVGVFDSIVNRVSIAHLTKDKLINVKLPQPPLTEQTAIANFLDRKTAQIDQAISIKEKQIELLKERRQILIHNAVTRGLDLDVKMKDSEVDGGDRRWIGEIPEHWEVFANRVLFTERNQSGREGLPLLSVSIHTAISSEELDEESNIRGKVKIEDKSSYKLVKVDDIVFNMMRAWQGAIGAVRVNGMVSPAYVVAKPNKKLDANYAEYQYRTSIYIQEMNRVSKGITDFRKRLYWHEFKQLTTILPPFEEQKEIVSYIENINEKIDTAISLKQKEIEKLKEYKSTLINSAVTGKIKLS